MAHDRFRSPVVATLAAAIAAASAGASAHTQNGSLGDAAEATDYYQVSCTDDGAGMPASLVVQIANRSPAPGASVVVHRGVDAVHSTDPVGGDTVASPLVHVDGGDGVYNVFVIKHAAGTLNYTLTFHCMTGPAGTGLHTGTTLVFRQNE